MAYGKTVQDVFEKFLTDNDRKIAEGKERNMNIERIKMAKKQQDEQSAMNRFNQAFDVMKAKEAQENRKVELEREDAAIERQQANRAEDRKYKLQDIMHQDKMNTLSREDKQAHDMEMMQTENERKDKEREIKEAEKNKPMSVSDRFLKLNSEQGKAVNSTIMALKGVDDAVSALTNGSNTFTVVGDNEFTQARALFVEGLARMQTGAAISKDEEKRFIKMLPTLADSPEIRAKKFNDMRQMLQGRLRRYGFEREDFEELTNSPSPVSVDAANNPEQARARLQELRSKYGR